MKLRRTAALLTGAKHLIFIPDGAMQSLPPGVLVTEPFVQPIAELPDHANVAWLAKQYSITVLPAVGTLRALRQFAKAPASREPFSGYGDPVLQGSGQDARRHGKRDCRSQEGANVGGG